MVGLLEVPRLSYVRTLRDTLSFEWLESLRPSSDRTVGLLEAHRFFMVELFEAIRFSYGWTLGVSPVFERFDSKIPLGFRMVGLSEALRFSYGWTFGYPHAFVWLDS